MYRQRTKRQQLIRSTIVYSVMITLVSVGLTVAVLYLLGYRFDSQNRTLSEGGIIQVATRPNGSTISLDGTTLASRTPDQLRVEAGAHTVRLTRDGYRPWQKTITVEPSGVHWLTYGLLVPKDPAETVLRTYPEVAATLPAPNRTQMLLQEDRTQADFRLLELDDDAEQAALSLPTSLLPDGDGVYEPVEWSDSSQRVLVQYRSGDDVRWYVLNTRDESDSVDVTSIIGENVSVRDVQFAGDSDRVLYILSGGNLRRVNVADRTVSAPLVGSVDSYTQRSDGTVAYVTQYDDATASREIGYYTPGADEVRQLQTIYTDDSTKITASLGEFQGDQYLAVQNDDLITLSDIELTSSDSDGELTTRTLAVITTDETADYVSFSPNDRFIIAQHDDTYVTYDIELDTYSTTTLQGSSPVRDELAWIDDYYVWSTRDDQLRLYEFDGGNRQLLGDAVPGLAPQLSQDSRELYVLRQTDDGVGLIEIQLRI